MKMQSCFTSLLFFTMTLQGQGKMEIIKTFEGKEKLAVQEVADAENKMNSDKPGLLANKSLWENKAEEIRINHGLKQHEEGSADFIYWKGEFEKANQQAVYYQGKIDVLQNSYDTKLKEKEQVIFDKNEAIRSFLDSLNSIEIPANCKDELDRAKAEIYTVTSSTLESLSHCWSVIFDNTKKGLKKIEGFVEIPSSFGSTAVVALTAEDMAKAEQKRQKIAAEMAKSTPTPKVPITVPPPVQSNQAEPTLTDRLKEIIKYMKKYVSPYPVKTPTAVNAVRG